MSTTIEDLDPKRYGRHTFNPTSRSFTNLNANQNVSFTAAPVTYSITGTVTLSSGAGLGGAKVTPSNGSSTTTASNGTYTFTGLAAGANLTVTPSRAGYTFNPSSRSFNGLNSNQTASFVAR